MSDWRSDVCSSDLLVGQLVLARLLESPGVARVVAPTRRPLALRQPVLENPVVDFDALPADAPWWAVDAAICTLGTTLAVAGSRDAFRRVDHDYPLAVARLARGQRSEEHTSELQSLMRISYAVFCLKKKKTKYK